MEQGGHPGDRPAETPTGPSRAPRHDDQGGSLVEVLCSIGLLGIVGVGVLVGLMAAIRGADQREQGVEVEARLVSAVDVLRSEGVPYVPCAGDPVAVADTYTLELQSAFADSHGIAVSVTAVSFWDGATLVTGCGAVPPHTLQSLSVQAVRGTTTAVATVTKVPGPVIP